MAINLKSLTRPTNRPVVGTIVGEGGIGKTSLAAAFKGPTVFIRTEDGTQSLAGKEDVALFPLASTYHEVDECVQALLDNDHQFKTVVVDSITQLNTIIEAEIVASDPKAKSIAQALGGYGAGLSAASEKHRQIREKLGRLMLLKSMNVIFIAHADSEQVDLPDQDPFTRYTIRMNRRSVSHYSDNVDLVAFIKLKTFTTGDKTKKATSDGTRIITCHPTPSHISKNRYGITTDLDFNLGENPFMQWIPSLQQLSVSV